MRKDILISNEATRTYVCLQNGDPLGEGVQFPTNANLHLFLTMALANNIIINTTK